MSSSKTTMQRKETKYKLNPNQCARLMGEVRAHLHAGDFAESRVNSIYLDTARRDSISRSLEKPLYKEKLRIRWYGDSSLDEAEEAFVELKKKFKGIVYKRRTKVVPSDAWAFAGAWDANEPAGDCVLGEGQIAQELREARRRLSLLGEVRPSALISCKRIAFGTDDDAGLRITFDKELQAVDLLELAAFEGVESPKSSKRTCAVLSDEAFAAAANLLDPGWAILEIKCANAYPLWLVRALSECKAYPTSFSKYGELYKKAAVGKGGATC